MNRRFNPSEVLLGSFLLLIVSFSFVGCATPPLAAQEQGDRDYERDDAKQVLVEQFNTKKRRCQRRGGHLVLIMGSGGKVDRRTMELAYCETRGNALYEGH